MKWWNYTLQQPSTEREVQYLSKEALNTTTINVNFNGPNGGGCTVTVIAANSAYSNPEYISRLLLR
jgi:hypothetical protein